MDIRQVPSPLFGYPQGRHGRNGQHVQMLVFHTMDGYGSYYHRIIAGELASPRNSANYSLYRDGHIEQHVADTDAAWCNGPVDRPDMASPAIAYCVSHSVNPNLVSISIECEGRSGEPWTAAQTASLIEWTRGKLAQYPDLTHDRRCLVSHHQIYLPKSCPGPSFPWAALLEAVKPVAPAGITATSTVPNDHGEPEQIGALFADWLTAHPGETPSKLGADGYHDRLLFLTSGKVLIGWGYTALGALDVVDRRA